MCFGHKTRLNDFFSDFWVWFYNRTYRFIVFFRLEFWGTCNWDIPNLISISDFVSSNYGWKSISRNYCGFIRQSAVFQSLCVILWTTPKHVDSWMKKTNTFRSLRQRNFVSEFYVAFWGKLLIETKLYLVQ